MKEFKKVKDRPKISYMWVNSTKDLYENKHNLILNNLLAFIALAFDSI